MNQATNSSGVSTRNIVLIAIAALLLLLCFFGCSSYNSMVTLDEKVNKAWSNVESQYQRRVDLIPNLVNTVKGAAKHEQSTLQGVTNARTGNIDAVAKAESDLTAAAGEAKALEGNTQPNAADYAKLQNAHANQQIR